MPLVSINPSTGQTIHRFIEHSRDEVDRIVDRSHNAFHGWRELAPSERGRFLNSLAGVLTSERDTLAMLITSEMGKPISQARAEIEKCAVACLYYARHGAAFLKPEHPPGAHRGSKVVFEPLGPVLAIMPWNFPFWQAFRAAVPTLLAGNTVLLKHASNVSGCALAIEELFKRAGFPGGVFQTLLVGSAAVSRLIASDHIAAITLTGSTAAGKQVAALAGAALKPCVLELGGSDPYLILGDADIALAAEVCATARLLNCGQSCIAAKRFIVVDSVRHSFEDQFVARMRARKVGDPLDTSTDVGPMARADLRDEVHRQVRESVRHGARLLLGGQVPDGAGFFYEPTVLVDVAKGMPAYEQELFGPVAAVIAVPDEEAAIATANDSRYGLGAAIFTRDRRRGELLAQERLEAGLVFVNDFVRSEPSLPFGGIKQSGYGRELGPYGMRAFVNTKTISLAPTSRSKNHSR
jgi:succinate-semialdehyde dehydrogenase/glutarate-semialdehyde dehydrogenase